jgi:type VI protein secretion system component VasA
MPYTNCTNNPSEPEKTIEPGHSLVHAWRLVSAVTLQYFCLLAAPDGEGRAGIRAGLGLYDDVDAQSLI